MKLISYMALIMSILCITQSYAKKDTKIIEILGNERIGKETILYYSDLKTEKIINKDKINLAVKNLYKLGHFSEIYIFYTNNNVKIKVVENPLVKKIYVKGNKKIKTIKIVKNMCTNIGSNYSKFNLNSDIKKIKALYKKIGYFFVRIHLNIQKQGNNKVAVKFIINEKKKVKIKSILFSGNRHFSGNYLNKIIFSRESIIKRIFFPSTYSANQILIDVKLLKNFYLQQGFINFKVLSSSLKTINNSNSIAICYIFSEGKKYNIGNVNVETKIKKVRELNLEELYKIKKGVTFNINEIKKIINDIVKILDKKDYIGIKIKFKLIKKIREKLVHIKICIEKNNTAFVNRINIQTKNKNLDKVVRGKIKFSEGELYNHANKVQKQKGISKMNLLNFIRFKKLDARRNEKVNINLKLKKAFTGLAKASIGYQNKVGFAGVLNISEYNFLDKERIVEINLSPSKNIFDVEIKFTEPNFYKKHVFSLELSSKYIRDEKNKYLNNVDHVSTFRLGSNIKKKVYYDVIFSKKSRYMKKKFWDSHFLLGNSIYYEKVDNKALPSKGYILKFTQNLAGINRNIGYIYTNINLNTYKKMHKKILFAMTNKVAYIKRINEKYISEEDKLFLGEEYIRGFEKSGIGPRTKKYKLEKNSKEESSLGGQKLLISNIEASFPIDFIKKLNIKGNVFADFGTLYEDKFIYNKCYSKNFRCVNINKINKIISFSPICNKKNEFNLDYINNSKKIRLSIGIGLVWNSNFGKIKLDYGIPIKKELFDNTSRIRFIIGTNF